MISQIEIIHGDSFKLLQDIHTNSVEAIITDPPYDFNEEQMIAVQRQMLRIAEHTVIVFCPPENQWAITRYKPDQYCFWVKPVSTKNTNKKYSRFVEMILIYQHYGAKWNSKRHWSQYVNVFHDSIERRMTHPFIKPASLMRRLIENHTDAKDIILDPFAGSGSTLLASIATSRHCIGIEKDKKLCSVIDKKIKDERKTQLVSWIETQEK